MIIGFFGKGGSGKTTTCFRFLQAVQADYTNVLAIDADHNMDLSFNLGVCEPTTYIGQSATDLDAFLKASSVFTLAPKDTFTEKYTWRVSSNIHLMISGPHTEAIFQGDLCSHSLFKPVVTYVSHMNKKDDQLVVVDNTAGMDSVGVGIPACLDVAIVCVEPALHSRKVGQQLVQGLQHSEIPMVIVANKVQTPEQREEIKRAFPDLPVMHIPFHPALLDPEQSLAEDTLLSFRELHAMAKAPSVLMNV